MTGVIYGPGQDRERERAVASRAAFSDLAAELADGVVSCSSPWHPDHLAAQYRWGEGLPDHWVCGICHPNLPGREVELRSDVEAAA